MDPVFLAVVGHAMWQIHVQVPRLASAHPDAGAVLEELDFSARHDWYVQLIPRL